MQNVDVLKTSLQVDSKKLKEVYFSIWQSNYHFLRCGCEGKIFKFRVLPFRISLDPETFACCMDAVLASRQQGLRILNYLDEWLVCAASQEQCRCHVALLLEHIQNPGLCLINKKSKR